MQVPLPALQDWATALTDGLNMLAHDQNQAVNIIGTVLDDIILRINHALDPRPTGRQMRFLRYLAGETARRLNADTLTKPQVSEAIERLLTFGETELQGITLHCIKTKRQLKNAALKKKLKAA